jgi:hypothetical protein
MYFAGVPLIERDLDVAKAPEQHRGLSISKPVLDQEAGLPVYLFDMILANA